MDEAERMRDGFAAALAGAARGRAVADRLCGACVDLLDVDGAALSVMYDGTLSRSFGSSSASSGELDELQFVLGEGPCLEALAGGAPVLAPDLNDRRTVRWPAFAEGAIARGVQAVFALPVTVASIQVGALDLYRSQPGDLNAPDLAGALIAAELAALPLLDLMGIDLNAAVTDETSGAWQELSALTRVEVYQAAGMLIGQLDVTAAEALVRLRGYAFAHNLSASEVAWQIIDRQLRLDDDNPTRHTREEDAGH
ncbi:MAG: ANTAR domain-containing protein [Actinomycetota bacterium]|nr:ANTAR domain-containing protein [Actinomycetota bacterium]